MRSAFLIAAGIAVCSGAPSSSWAQDAKAQADELVEQGNRLGAEGQLEAAVSKFFAAEKLYARALHDCNIGLAYIRLTRWADAHFFLRSCRARWTRDDGPQPTWLTENLRGLEQQLEQGSYGRLRISVSPEDAEVVVTSFVDRPVIDAWLWLPSGEHRVRATRPGLPPVTNKAVVSPHSEQTMTLTLSPAGTTARIEPGTTTSPGSVDVTTAAPTSPGDADRTYLIAGLASTGVGLSAFALGWVFYAKGKDAEQAGDDLNRDVLAEIPVPDYYEQIDGHRSDARRNRILQWTSFGVAGALIGVGGVLIFRGLGSGEDTSLGVVPTRGGGVVSTGWSF